MDFDAYARTAVDIVNAPLNDMADLTALFGARSWLTPTATDRDLTTLRRAQKRLRDVFEHGSACRDSEAVTELNALLDQHPIQPRISGHDADGRDPDGRDPDGRDPDVGPADRRWHMHVASRGSAANSEVLAGAVWGLAVWLCEHGSSRFGVCADERCGNVYLDTSSNCCRRFCSERCATRSHVAAHRARKRAAESQVAAPTAPVPEPVRDYTREPATVA